jgi:hypothetical protein
LEQKNRGSFKVSSCKTIVTPVPRWRFLLLKKKKGATEAAPNGSACVRVTFFRSDWSFLPALLFAAAAEAAHVSAPSAAISRHFLAVLVAAAAAFVLPELADAALVAQILPDVLPDLDLAQLGQYVQVEMLTLAQLLVLREVRSVHALAACPARADRLNDPRQPDVLADVQVLPHLVCAPARHATSC